MKLFKRIIFRTFIILIALIVIVIIITSTTGFEIQRNPMEYFFSQHKEIDSVLFEEKLSKELVLNDIDYLVKTIEEVHPNPFCYISKEDFYAHRDTIKQLIQGDISRDSLYSILTTFVKLLKDGHTQIKFPERSEGEDNKSIFDKSHNDFKKLITYQNLMEKTGYLHIKDFVIDKKEFKFLIDSVFCQIHKDSIENLIIDIRDNPGGNSELADYLISYIYDKPFKGNSMIQIKRSDQYYKYMKGYFSWWFKPFLLFIKSIRDYKETPIGDIYEDVKGYKQPIYHADKFHGKVYLLINANTFSTALGFATVIKDYKIATIIGEQTKAEVNEFGDIFPFDLPKSRLWVWCSAKRYIRPSGELTIGGLNPDILISDQDNDIINFTINKIKTGN
jgi:hypothetical protein